METAKATTGETQMTIYRNTKWTSRNYETTNIRFQRASAQPRNYTTGAVDLANWVEVDPVEVALWEELGCDYLKDCLAVEYIGSVAGAQFWGHM